MSLVGMGSLIGPIRKKKQLSPSALRREIERDAMRDMYPHSKPKRPIRKGGLRREG